MNVTGYFRKYRDTVGEWRWTYYSSNNEPIGVSSEGYKEERACDRAIEIMRNCGGSPTR